MHSWLWKWYMCYDDIYVFDVPLMMKKDKGNSSGYLIMKLSSQFMNKWTMWTSCICPWLWKWSMYYDDIYVFDALLMMKKVKRKWFRLNDIRKIWSDYWMCGHVDSLHTPYLFDLGLYVALKHAKGKLSWKKKKKREEKEMMFEIEVATSRDSWEMYW